MANMEVVGLKKCTLRELEPYKTNIMITCIIINKQKPRKYKSNDGQERAVWNFTARDSPGDYINVTCWGSVANVFGMNDRLQIRDIVNIERPSVELRRLDDSGEQYHPTVTSPYKLSVNESGSNIKIIQDTVGLEYLLQLLNVPTKPIANYFTLANIHSNIKHLEGKFVDILVSVLSIGEVRRVKTRFGESSVRNVVVFDQSNPGLKITIWDEEFIARAAIWKPRLTILFMTDMKLTFDKFYSCASASLTVKTIITEDPACNEANYLRNYAKNAAIQPSAILDQMAVSIPDPSTINTIMNVRQVQTKVETILNMNTTQADEQQFTALVYATVTYLDIDGGINKVIKTKCALCKMLINKESNTCENQVCLVGMGEMVEPPETKFNIRLTLSDHTGSLTNCILDGKYAERTLSCTPQEFQELSDDERGELKWKFLMERCAVRILVLCPKFRSPLITILSCNLSSLEEYINRL